MQLGTQLPPVGATEGATATQQKPALSDGKEINFDAVMLGEISTEITGGDTLQDEIAVLTPTSSPEIMYSSFAVVPELATGATHGGTGETITIDTGGKTPSQIAETGAPKSDADPESGGILLPLTAIKEVVSGVLQAGADSVTAEVKPKAVHADTTTHIVGGAVRDLVQGGARKAPSWAEAMTPPPPGSSVEPGSRHVTESHAEKRQGQAANAVAEQPKNAQVQQPLTSSAAANTAVMPKPQLRQGFGTGPVKDSDVQMTQKTPPPLSSSGTVVEKVVGSKNAPTETSGISVSDRQLTEIRGVSYSSTPSNSTSQYTGVKDTAHFIATGRLPETSEIVLMQDGVMPAATVLSTSDPILAELGSDIAMIEVRAAETLTARAEASAQLRAELPRHIAQQLADVARTMPDRPIELTLSPEELGRLRLTFTGDLSAMSVSVNVERPETLDLMRRHIEILAQEMREIGYGEVTFSFEQSGSEAGGQSHDAPASSDREDQHMNPTGISPNIPPSPVRLSMTGASGVDIRL